jgi:hypothetical protein
LRVRQFAVTVSDDQQNKGLCTVLMKRLMEVAKARGIRVMHLSDAADSSRMSQLAEHLGLGHRHDPGDATLVLYSIDLTAPGAFPAACSIRAYNTSA